MNQAMSKGFGFMEFMDELVQKQTPTGCQGTVGLESKPVLLSAAVAKGSYVKPVEYNQLSICSYNQCFQQYQTIMPSGVMTRTQATTATVTPQTTIPKAGHGHRKKLKVMPPVTPGQSSVWLRPTRSSWNRVRSSMFTGSLCTVRLQRPHHDLATTKD